MLVNILKDNINDWKNHSYLAKYSFDCDSRILQDALDIFQSDYNRWYVGNIDFNKINITPQLQAVLCYRIAHNIHLQKDTLTGGVADLYSLLGRLLGQIEIFYSCTIGTGFKINHGVGSVIGARCVIGNNFTIHQNCTLGDKNGGRPVIGDDVIMYAGSMVLGNIHVLSNSVIGANTLVINEFKEGGTLVGSPAKLIKR